MSRMAVIYWSMTGNTEAMANAIAEGAAGAGAEVDVKQVCDTTVDEALGYGLLALGCPAMGAEVLEEAEFEPMFESVKPSLGGKTIGLFGSYGWGDGEWMRTWAADCEDAGCSLVCEPVIACGAPEGDAADACRELGKALAAV